MKHTRLFQRLAVGLFVAFSLAAPASAAAPPQSLALLPASGINVNEGVLEAARDILKGHLLRTGRYNVIAPSGRPGTDELAPQQAAEQGRALGAELAAVLRITRLGNSATVRFTVYRVADAQVGHYDDLQAATPDDLDPVLARLASGLATGKPARLAAEIDTVTEKESAALPKRTATRSFGVRLGTALALNRAGGAAEPVPGAGIFWLYDARSWLADLYFDVGINDDNSVVGVGLGAYYPFRREDLTPYIGGGMRYGATRFGGDTAAGLALQAAVGILFGRLGTVQFRGEIGYFVNTYGEHVRDYSLDYGYYAPSATGQGAPTAPSATKYYSHGPSLMVGLGF